MRPSIRDAIEAAEAALSRKIDSLAEVATQERLGESDRLMKAIEEIQPASVNLSQELADDIVRKMHGPLTIGQGFSDWIRQEAQHHDVLVINRIGYSATAGDMQVTLKTNGTLQIEMRDAMGSRLWFGTFVPPDTMDT